MVGQGEHVQTFCESMVHVGLGPPSWTKSRTFTLWFKLALQICESPRLPVSVAYVCGGNGRKTLAAVNAMLRRPLVNGAIAYALESCFGSVVA